MKHVEIFYFSGTGNTWWVSQRIAESLSDLGFSAETHSIEQISMDQVSSLITNADIVGLGFPVYGSDAPRNFMRFLKGLPDLPEPKETLGFVTQMAWSGDGFNFLREMMAEKGYRAKWTAEFNMPNNIAIPSFPFPYTSNYNAFERRLRKCKRKVERLCERIAANEPHLEHSDLFSTASAWIQRGPFRWIHDWGTRLWSVDQEKCISCARCADICPVQNIHMENGLAVHTEECIYCMRCFNYCPTLAVHYAGFSNRRAEKKSPFKGPVESFKPELITKTREK